jgi:hypothetical protein
MQHTEKSLLIKEPKQASFFQSALESLGFSMPFFPINFQQPNKNWKLKTTLLG